MSPGLILQMRKLRIREGSELAGSHSGGEGWSARPRPSSAPRLGVVCLPPPPSDQQRSPRRLPGTPPWHSLVGEDLAQGLALGSDREGLLSNPADTTGLPAAREAAGPGRWARQVSPAEPRGLSPPEQLTGWAEVGGRAEKAFRLQESPHFCEPASLAACLGVRGVQKVLDNGGQMELRVCWT